MFVEVSYLYQKDERVLPVNLQSSVLYFPPVMVVVVVIIGMTLAPVLLPFSLSLSLSLSLSILQA